MDKSQKINGKMIIGNLIMLIGIIIFVSIFSSVFGSGNTLVGVIIITAILMFSSISVSLKFKDALFGIIISFLALGVVSYVTMLHPYIGVPINFIFVFLITYVFTNKIETKVYLPFILCYVFLQGSPVSSEELPKRIASLLIGGLLVAIIYYFSHKKASDEDHRSLKEMFHSIDIHSLQGNFALRMAIGITISMFIGGIFGFVKGMWISATVLSLTQPNYSQTKERIPERIIGTIIGAVIFIVLFYFIVPKSLDSMVLLIIGYIYMFVKPYKLQMIFVTLNSLAAAMILFDASVSVPMRIAFLLVGILIAVVVNKPLYKLYESKNKEELSK